MRVKGKDQAVAIFQPLGLSEQLDASRVEEAQLFQQALKLYRSQDWKMAELRLAELLSIAPDSKLYRTYLERVAFLRANPPGPAWDGAFTFETK